MEEKIIIDGVDVSECEKLGETISGITCGLGKRIRFANEIITKHTLCEDNPNCYYKQLKRLEQENEELKQKYEKLYEHQGEIVKAYSLNKNKLFLYKHALEEIKKISRVNPVDSCWTLLNTCGNCPEKSECNHSLQSPFTVIREIENIITEAIGE